MSHWRAKGGQTCRGSEPIRPSFEPGTQRGSNVIQLADHQTAPSPDDRLNSERLTVAPLFIREFAAWCFAIGLVLFSALFVSATVIIYAALVS